jgi:hypothetical protein
MHYNLPDVSQPPSDFKRLCVVILDYSKDALSRCNLRHVCPRFDKLRQSAASDMNFLCCAIYPVVTYHISIYIRASVCFFSICATCFGSEHRPQA